MEDKLLMFKSLLMKHSEDISCANMIRDLQSVLKVNRKLWIKSVYKRIMEGNKSIILKSYFQDEEIGLPDKIHLEELKYDKVGHANFNTRNRFYLQSKLTGTGIWKITRR